MVEFGKRLEEERSRHTPEWGRHCIDYGALKDIIKSEKQQLGLVASYTEHQSHNGVASESLAEHLASCKREETSLRFRYALDREIEKAVLFVLREQGAIACTLDELAERRANFVDETNKALESNNYALGDRKGAVHHETVSGVWIDAALTRLNDLHTQYENAARQVLAFVSFVDLNVTAVRKILKKHDKQIHNPREKLSKTYLSAYTNEYVDSHLDQLYNDGGLSSLVATLRRAFGELHLVKLELRDASVKSMSQTERGGGGGTAKQSNAKEHRRIQSQPAGYIDSLMAGNGTIASSIRGSIHGFFHERSASVSGNTATELIGEGVEDEPTYYKEPLMDMIQLSRDKLKHSTKYVDIVAAQAMFFDERDSFADTAEGLPLREEITTAQHISSLLNLLSTFLYMTNYYIVAPTCGQYAARVGSDESMAGIVIGMTPNAALLATILYGWWSNHSYKSALIFAASSSVLGNVAYGLALHHDSITLILVGRFLNGFGSARSINRRFIADTFSKRDRTAASAAFVTAGALGMACGPALAALLSRISFPMESTLMTVETSPAWVMLFLWTIFLVSSIFFFEEPDRSHIFGPKKTLELASKSNKSGEAKYLLSSVPSEIQSSKEQPLWANVPVMTTLWIYFVLKLVLECLLSSCPTLTHYYFGWDSRHSGAFLAFLGLLMFPANMAVARLSQRYEDREVIYYSLVIMACAITGFLSYRADGGYSINQYVLFAMVIFLSTNALEGPNMGLLSKTIPKAWAKGIFNTGFLATEAGTAARSVGDVLITYLASNAGVDGLLNGLFGPMLFLVVLSVILTRTNYDQMVEYDEDDDSK